MIDTIIAKFLDDRESLTKEELELLLEALRKDPKLARALKEDLVFEDLLSRALSLDRKDFPAQVAQRIRDLNTDKEFGLPGPARRSRPGFLESLGLFLKGHIPLTAGITILLILAGFISFKDTISDINPELPIKIKSWEIILSKGGEAKLETKYKGADVVRLASGIVELLASGQKEKIILVETPLGKAEAVDAHFSVELKGAGGNRMMVMIVSIMFGNVEIRNRFGQIKAGPGDTVVVSGLLVPKIQDKNMASGHFESLEAPSRQNSLEEPALPPIDLKRIENTKTETITNTGIFSDKVLSIAEKAKGLSVLNNNTIKNVTIIKKVILFDPAGAQIIKDLYLYAENGKYRMEGRINTGKKTDTETVLINDGAEVWAKTSSLGVVNLRAAEKNENEIENNWWDYVSEKAVLKDTEMIDQKECYVIELESKKDKGLKFSKVWVDRSEYRLLKAEINNFMKRGIKVTLKCSDFRRIEGNTVLPFLSEISSGGKLEIISKLTDVKINKFLPPSLFELTEEDKESLQKTPHFKELLKKQDPKNR